jgi:ELWxxDGT repeat protein
LKPFLLFACAATIACTSAYAQQIPELVKDFSGVGGGGNYLREGVVFNNKLVALTGVTGQQSFNEVIATDGSNAGTKQVTTTISSDILMNPVPFNGKMYFVMQTGTSGYHNSIYYTNGVDFAGTQEINPQGSGIDVFSAYSLTKLYNCQWLTVMGNKLYFFGTNTPGMNYELYSSDGTLSGTQMVKEINLHGNDGAVHPFAPEYFAMLPIGNTLYFTGNDYQNGAELWKSDGTATGTVLVKDINTTFTESGAPANFIEFNNKLFFCATETGAASDTSFWMSDGTGVGTVKLKDGLFNYRDYAIMNNKLYFYAEELPGNTGGLWVTDGTVSGTKKITSVAKGYNTFGDFNKPIHLTAVNGKLVYAANTNSLGNELWVSDGNASANMLKDLNNAPEDSYPSNFLEVNGRVYFKATSGFLTPGEHIDVWSTDGTLSGTVKHTKPGTNVALQGDQRYFIMCSPLLRYNNYVVYSNTYDLTTGGVPYYKINTFGVGVPELAYPELAVSVYPMPASIQVTVKAEGMNSVDVYSVTGALLMTKDAIAESADIDVQSLAPGFYALTVHTKDGGVYKTKFIKE